MHERKSESEVAQSCPTLSDPKDCSLSGSSVHGIFQARVLEWGAIAFSRSCTDKLLNLNLQGLLLSSLREAFSVYIQHGREFLMTKAACKEKLTEKKKKKKNSNTLRTKNNEGIIHGGTVLALQAEKVGSQCPTSWMKSPASDGRAFYFSLSHCSTLREPQAHHYVSSSHHYVSPSTQLR